MELTDVIDQLRLFGVEVFWSTALDVAAVWSAKHRFLVVSVTHSRREVADLCRQALDQVRPPLVA